MMLTDQTEIHWVWRQAKEALIKKFMISEQHVPSVKQSTKQNSTWTMHDFINLISDLTTKVKHIPNGPIEDKTSLKFILGASRALFYKNGKLKIYWCFVGRKTLLDDRPIPHVTSFGKSADFQVWIHWNSQISLNTKLPADLSEGPKGKHLSFTGNPQISVKSTFTSHTSTGKRQGIQTITKDLER